MSAASASRIHKWRARWPLGAGHVSVSERETASALKSVRECLQLPPKEFAAALGVSVAALERFETFAEPWVETALTETSLARLAELCAAAQTRVDEAAASLAEVSPV